LTLGAILLCSGITVSSGVFDRVEEEINCLAQNIYYEARGEPRKGKIAVGHVTLNRVKSKGYPNSVCGVISQKHKKTCQFSWMCMPKLPKIRQDLYDDIRSLAESIYYGEIKDVTGGATHFHSVHIQPIWANTKRMTTQIGNHLFYRK
jgi:spore germination cell wall hydrolase CwlJ-like protein